MKKLSIVTHATESDVTGRSFEELFMIFIKKVGLVKLTSWPGGD